MDVAPIPVFIVEGGQIPNQGLIESSDREIPSEFQDR